jgi:phenylpyruvate tautomerase PptA (4-oxalocrotonate tautomerase family)
MPTLIIQTNVEVPAERRKVTLEAASSLVAEQLGKPESYVMVLMQHNPDMLFGVDSTPLAYLELKSLGLPEDRTPALSAALCTFMERHFGVPPARVYIEFASPPRHLFGWNGGTF